MPGSFTLYVRPPRVVLLEDTRALPRLRVRALGHAGARACALEGRVVGAGQGQPVLVGVVGGGLVAGGGRRNWRLFITPVLFCQVQFQLARHTTE